VQVTKAFKILQGDPKVKAILVNIFGGIMKCDTIATGIIQAAKEVRTLLCCDCVVVQSQKPRPWMQVNLRVPLVVRLEGTNVDIGKKLLQNSGIKLTTADDLDDAAKKAVATMR
jgi:succinyl-CoA synthetase beta subunit